MISSLLRFLIFFFLLLGWELDWDRGNIYVYGLMIHDDVCCRKILFGKGVGIEIWVSGVVRRKERESGFFGHGCIEISDYHRHYQHPWTVLDHAMIPRPSIYHIKSLYFASFPENRIGILLPPLHRPRATTSHSSNPPNESLYSFQSQSRLNRNHLLYENEV